MKYGCHRVIEPKGVFPQAAYKLDNTPKAYDDEILIQVETLNIDSASFKQIKDEVGEKGIAKRIMEIVEERGKMHNPVTNSGGMLIGKIKEIGKSLEGKIDAKVGDRIATLVSLTLTPLKLYRIKKIKGEQIDVDAYAILFESSIFAKLPEDIDAKVALAALDVAGAAPLVGKLVKEGDTVLILGAGKSGMLCTYEARKRTKNGKVIVMTRSKKSAGRIKSLGYADYVFRADATNPLEVLDKIEKVTKGELCDVVINAVNASNTEMASIVSAKDGGKICFFSMATSFQKAALGAEGIGKDVYMLIGNGYSKGHAEYTLNILRESKPLMKVFKKLYGN